MSERHAVTFRRFVRGKTPIRPQRLLYGFTLVCECGWRSQVNGTKTEAKARARRHTAEFRVPRAPADRATANRQEG